MDPKQPDRFRGERLKLWGVLILTVLLVVFLYVRHAYLAHGAR